MSRPASRTRPELGRTSPVIVRSSEVLPAPLAPSTAVTDPSGTSSDTSSTRPDRPVVGGQLLNREHRSAPVPRARRPSVGLAPEVGLEHARILLHLRRLAVGDHAGRSRARRRGRTPTSRSPCGGRRASPRPSSRSAPISSPSSASSRASSPPAGSSSSSSSGSQTSARASATRFCTA